MSAVQQKKEQLRRQAEQVISTQEKGIQEIKDAQTGAGGWNETHIARVDELVEVAPDSHLCPLLYFLKGTIQVALKDYDGTQATAERVLAQFPSRPEGSFLFACGLIAVANRPEATRAAQKGRTQEAVLEQDAAQVDPFVHDTMNRLFNQQAQNAKASKKEEFRKAMKAHGDKFNAFSGGTCSRCQSVYTTPTPQWMCVKCWPLKEELVWEPDGASCCSCKEKPGMFGRHHCRCCGHVVCGKCSDKTKSSVGLLNYLDRVRVCKTCHSLLQEEGSTRHL